MKHALCVGILVADVIGRPIDGVPAPGALALVPSITPHIGGCAANSGIGLQTLGIETLVAGKVGRDGFGDFVRAELEKAGVQTAIAVDETTPTSATMVLVRSDAERTFLHCTGANATFELERFRSRLARWRRSASYRRARPDAALRRRAVRPTATKRARTWRADQSRYGGRARP